MVSPLDLFELSFALFLISNEVNYCLSKHAVRLGLSLLELQLLWTIVRFETTNRIGLSPLTRESISHSAGGGWAGGKTYHEGPTNVS